MRYIQKNMVKMRVVQPANERIEFVEGIIGDQIGKIQSKINESQVNWLRNRLFSGECMI